MTENDVSGSRLLLMISRIKQMRRFEDVEYLTDAELSMQMGACLSDDANERRTISCAFALGLNSDVQATVAQFQEIGVSISPDELIAMQQEPAFLEFKKFVAQATVTCKGAICLEQMRDLIQRIVGRGSSGFLPLPRLPNGPVRSGG